MKYRVMYVRKETPGNTNEGLSVGFSDHEAPMGVEPLPFIGDSILDWDEQEILAIGVKIEDEWQIMSLLQYTDLLEQRTKDKEDSTVEVVLGKMKENAGTTAWNVDDYVAIALSDDTYCIGYIKEINTGIATVYEVHAFHRLWGGSNGGRGMLHHIPLEQLYPCPRYYRHIVKEVKDKQ